MFRRRKPSSPQPPPLPQVVMRAPEKIRIIGRAWDSLRARRRPGTLEYYQRDRRLMRTTRRRIAELNEMGTEILRMREQPQDLDPARTYTIEQIRGTYAIEAIESYLVLPAATATTLPLEDGKTGLDLLNEQLDLLIEAGRREMAAASRNRLTQMKAHGSFLHEKFSSDDPHLAP